jgi:chromosome segregation ATPase
MKTPGAVAAKAYLRDCLKRCAQIRKRCGKDDDKGDQRESSGDPFRDKTQQFSKDIGSLKEMILERNEGQKKMGNDRDAIEQSHDINRLLRKLDHDLLQIKAMVDQSDRQLAKANKKKKKNQDKINLLEQQLRGRQTAYDMCAELLAGARKMNEQRFGGAQPKKGKGGSAALQMTIGKKMSLNPTLDDVLKKDRNKQALGQETSPAGDGGEDSSPQRLEDNPETAEQMKVLKEQEKKLNAGLDRLGKNIGRLHELAIQIGVTLDEHTAGLDGLEDDVDNKNKELRAINRRLKGLIKKSKPMNTFITIGCFLLLLSLVGYFLYQFGVV